MLYVHTCAPLFQNKKVEARNLKRRSKSHDSTAQILYTEPSAIGAFCDELATLRQPSKASRSNARSKNFKVGCRCFNPKNKSQFGLESRAGNILNVNKNPMKINHLLQDVAVRGLVPPQRICWHTLPCHRHRPPSRGPGTGLPAGAYCSRCRARGACRHFARTGWNCRIYRWLRYLYIYMYILYDFDLFCFIFSSLCSLGKNLDDLDEPWLSRHVTCEFLLYCQDGWGEIVGSISKGRRPIGWLTWPTNLATSLPEKKIWGQAPVSANLNARSC